MNDDLLRSFFPNKVFRDERATLLLSRIVLHKSILILNLLLTNFLIKKNC